VKSAQKPAHYPSLPHQNFSRRLLYRSQIEACRTNPRLVSKALWEGNEDEGQVETLRKAVMANLDNVSCYRVGEIEIEIYLLGKEGSGYVCGLQILNVET